MSFDEIFDLTAGVYFNFYNNMRSENIAAHLKLKKKHMDRGLAVA